MTPLDDQERSALRMKARVATLAALHSLGGEARRNAIRARALADGGFTPRELRAPAPPAAADKHDGMVEYQLSWTLTNLKHDGLVENPKWATWKLAGAALDTPQPATEEPVAADRLTGLRELPYRKYLRTPEWRRTRAAALLRANHCCSLDVTHTEGLEVHHRTYERLGEELASDVIVLCRECHRLHHAAHGRPSRRVTPRGKAPVASKPSLLQRLMSW